MARTVRCIQCNKPVTLFNTRVWATNDGNEQSDFVCPEGGEHKVD